jgi:hypothetical protein
MKKELEDIHIISQAFVQHRSIYDYIIIYRTYIKKRHNDILLINLLIIIIMM